MVRIRGFRLRNRFTRHFRWVTRRRPHRLRPSATGRLFTWMRRVVETLSIPGRRYLRLGREPVRVPVPEGHVAIYVGQKGSGGFQRVLVPVVYMNHPLFGELLRESEREFGFDYPGGLTLPVRISELQRVRSRIEAGRTEDRSLLKSCLG